MARPDAQVARQSVFPVKANSTTHEAVHPQSNTDHGAPTKRKRKRRVSDPADAMKIAAKRRRGVTCATTVTEHPYAPTAPRVTEHHGAPTTPKAAPTAPKATSRSSKPTSKAVIKQDIPNIRYIPTGSTDYDLAIRTEDPPAWAQWATDLRKEIRALRHLPDVGPYTLGIIAMMTEDGVWPKDSKIGLGGE
ncbi:hypothetical protein HO133_008373 [Letharia lupina]|uniref:Uncharacterized protein n=1 Tax=Letharia lupina TaxID=560253 RepID=A0A8H6CP05_9LECA|nr:uncharacterized protein HO133_008373 [Letharia lupina]KAF6226932.1 hypothetical protein HO133_008373 [Letharia lupina]